MIALSINCAFLLLSALAMNSRCRLAGSRKTSGMHARAPVIDKNLSISSYTVRATVHERITIAVRHKFTHISLLQLLGQLAKSHDSTMEVAGKIASGYCK